MCVEMFNTPERNVLQTQVSSSRGKGKRRALENICAKFDYVRFVALLWWFVANDWWRLSKSYMA